MTKYDVIIVGAGPAGIAFARRLTTTSPGKSVLLLEREEHPREKPCGDALTYLSVPLLREIFPELAATIPSASRAANYRFTYPGGRALHGHDGQLDVIPRRELDDALWQTLEPTSVERRSRATVTGLLTAAGRVTGVQVAEANRRYDVAADLVVGADGSTSIVRRETSRGTNDPARVAIRGYVRGTPRADHGLLFFVDPEYDGYFWIFPFHRGEETWANVGYYAKPRPNRPLKQRLLEFLASARGREFLQSGQLTGELRGFPVKVLKTRLGTVELPGQAWGPGFLLLGDAAGLVQPHTGEGIAAALHSGKAAAELVSDGLPEAARGTEYERRILTYAKTSYAVSGLLTSFHVPSMLPRFCRAPYLGALFWYARRRGATTEA